MDLSDHHTEDSNEDDVYEDAPTRPRQLPADLPKSLDDRQPVKNYGGETEMYDAWQGKVRTSERSLTSGILCRGVLLSRMYRVISISNQPNSCSTTWLQPFLG